MTDHFTAFQGSHRIATGPLAEVALAIKHANDGADPPILIFSDATGRAVDFDLRGSDADVVARLQQPAATAATDIPRGRGRPKLGVVAREVTLLPRHWDWLGRQPRGVSGTLRRLVEYATREPEPQATARLAQEATDRFMQVMAGDLAGYEEASRALYAGDAERLERQIRDWPRDVRAYVVLTDFESSSPRRAGYKSFAEAKAQRWIPPYEFYPPDAPASGVPHSDESDIRNDWQQDALERLPAGYREVLILREMEELSYREIATVIDAPVGTVMSRLARARGRLAVLLGARNEERAAMRGAAHPDEAGSADGGLRAGSRCATPAAATGTGIAPGRERDGPGPCQQEARDEL